MNDLWGMLIGWAIAAPICLAMGYYGSRYTRTGSFRKKKP